MPSSEGTVEVVMESGDIVILSGVELAAPVVLSSGNRTGMPVLGVMLNMDAIDCIEPVMLSVVRVIMVVLSGVVPVIVAEDTVVVLIYLSSSIGSGVED